MGQSQPPATTAYMTLARCQAVADTGEIIEIKFDSHRKLHNKLKRTKMWTDFFFT